MLRITMSQLCSRFRNLAIASLQSAARITASLRCASSRPNCSAWSRSSSMSKTLSIDTPGAGKPQWTGRTANVDFATCCKVVDTRLIEALSEGNRHRKIRAAHNDIQLVLGSVVPNSEGPFWLQQLGYVLECIREEQPPIWKSLHFKGEFWVYRDGIELPSRHIPVDHAYGCPTALGTQCKCGIHRASHPGNPGVPDRQRHIGRCLTDCVDGVRNVGAEAQSRNRTRSCCISSNFTAIRRSGFPARVRHKAPYGGHVPRSAGWPGVVRHAWPFSCQLQVR